MKKSFFHDHRGNLSLPRALAGICIPLMIMLPLLQALVVCGLKLEIVRIDPSVTSYIGTAAGILAALLAYHKTAETIDAVKNPPSAPPPAAP